MTTTSKNQGIVDATPAPVPVEDRCYCHACCCGDGFCIRSPRPFWGTPKKRKARKGGSR